MHHQRGLARAACTARDAYNPALALTSALLASSNDAALGPSVHTAPSCRIGRNPLTSQRGAFSSSSYAKKQAQARAHDQDGGHSANEQKQKPQKRGTFAGYEALMDTFGSAPSAQQDHSELSKRTRGALSSTLQTGSAYQPPTEPAHDRNPGPSRHQRRRDEYPFDSRPRNSGDHRRGGRLRNRGNDRTGRILDDWKGHMHRLGERANKLAQQKPTYSTQEFDEAKRTMNYTGMPIAVEQPGVKHQTPFPWAVGSGENGTATEMLNHEINSFASYMGLTNPEVAARQSVRKEMMGFIGTQVGGSMQTTLFGSEVTGLSSATSDLDFRLYARSDLSSPMIQRGVKESDFTVKSMRTLANRMTGSPDWIATVFRNARFPIINAQHRQTGIDMQIVSSPSTEPQQEATLHYLKQIPNLKALYSVIKNMFGIRGLVDVFNGGAGSYGLLMMLVASLTRRGADFTNAESGAQLLQFLDFYCAHDYRQNGIAIAPPSSESIAQTTLFRKHYSNGIPRAAYIRAAYARDDPIRAGQWSIGQRRPFQPYLPCVQDPANPLNDLGRKMNAIKHIVATLRQVREELKGRLEQAEKGQLGEGVSLLEPAVGRCHEVYFERRRRVEEYGLGIMTRNRDKKQAKELEKMKAENERQQQPVETAWAG